MECRFSQSEYHTAPDHPESVLFRLLPGTTVPFYCHVAKCVVSARSHAIQGRFDDCSFAAHSALVLERIEECGGRLHITGLDAVRGVRGPVVFVGNHMSTLETFALPAMLLPIRPLAFVIKESLLDFPVFGPIMRASPHIAVTRADIKEDLKRVMTGGAEMLAAGKSVVIFPQHTRRVEFIVSQFNTLAVKLAHRAGVPVVPVALKTDLWGNGRWVKGFGRIDTSQEVRFTFGAPIDAQGHPKETHGQVLGFLKKHLPAWGLPWIE